MKMTIIYEQEMVSAIIIRTLLTEINADDDMLSEQEIGVGFK